MITGSLARPLLVGVISWTGPRCGADRLPTVAAEVAHHLDLLTDPQPVWAPVPGGPVTITGQPRVGGTLTCEIPAWAINPEQIEIRWSRRVRRKKAYVFTRVGSDPTYSVQPADRGRVILCEVRGSGPGGRTATPPGPRSQIRIAG